MNQTDVHAEQPVLAAGATLEQATSAMIMVHGRGAGAADILGLSSQIRAESMAFLAPQAAGSTWYPYSFLVPIEQNEPHLTSALHRLGSLVEQLDDSGIGPDRVILLGFSQGACLATEFVARNARRFGGVCGLSGGLIGPPGTPRDYEGTLDGTPVFLGCSDVDFHIPVERVYETEKVLRNLGGEVTARIYPGMGHTINRDEIDRVQQIVDSVADSP